MCWLMTDPPKNEAWDDTVHRLPSSRSHPRVAGPEFLELRPVSRQLRVVAEMTGAAFREGLLAPGGAALQEVGVLGRDHLAVLDIFLACLAECRRLVLVGAAVRVEGVPALVANEVVRRMCDRPFARTWDLALA